jgi:hypothetical protein
VLALLWKARVVDDPGLDRLPGGDALIASTIDEPSLEVAGVVEFAAIMGAELPTQ